MKIPKLRWKLRTKWTLAYSILILIVSGSMAFGLSWQLRNIQRQALRERLLDIVRFSAPLVDGDFHSLIRVPVDNNNSFYRVVSLKLESIQGTSAIIEHIYTLRQGENGKITYVVDVSSSPASVGQEYELSSPLLKDGLNEITEPVVEAELRTDSSGTYLSGFAPIYNQFGEIDAVLGIDINASLLLENEKKARRAGLAAFLASVPFSVLLGWRLAHYLIAPINALVQGVERVAQGQLEEEVLVQGEDELGLLAHTFNHMTRQLRQTLAGLEKEIAEHERSEKIQEVIYRISQAAISTDSIEEFYASVHHTLGELIPVENFYIGIYNPSSNLIQFPYYVDQYDEKPLIQESGKGLTGYILRTGRPLLVDSEELEKHIEQGKLELVGTKPLFWLGTPLKVEGRTIGAAVVQSYTDAVCFNQEDLNLMEFVSSQVALALDHKRSAEMLHQSNERYRGLFEDSPISLWEEDFSSVKRILDDLTQTGITDYQTYFMQHPEVVAECAAQVRVLDVNKATLLLFNAKSKEQMLNNLSTVFCDESYQLFKNELTQIANGHTTFSWDGVNQTLDGQRIEVNINWSVVPGYEEDLSKVIISMVDITERQKAESRLKHMSTHDALTGLYNRAYFDEELIRLEQDRQFPVTVVMADLDNLKGTNDRFGHAAGDALLCQAAQVMKEAFRSEDIVARIGGDEFAVLLPNITGSVAEKTIQRIRDYLYASTAPDVATRLCLSLGMSTAEVGDSLNEVLKQADANMYLEKQKKASLAQQKKDSAQLDHKA